MITKPFVGVLWVLCATAASASAAEPACVTVEQGWARLPPNPAMPMTAGYGVIHNRCSKAVAITGTDHGRMNRELGTDAGKAQTEAVDAFLKRVFG